MSGPCLHESGLTPKKFSYKDDAELVNYGIGLASLVPRTTASVEELSTSVFLYHDSIVHAIIKRKYIIGSAYSAIIIESIKLRDFSSILSPKTGYIQLLWDPMLYMY